MCPLRVLLIFLSATLAGFFVLRGLKTQPVQDADETTTTSAAAVIVEGSNPKEPVSCSIKVRSVICSGFWTCVDMASGRYLWRNLISSSSENKKC